MRDVSGEREEKEKKEMEKGKERRRETMEEVWVRELMGGELWGRREPGVREEQR